MVNDKRPSLAWRMIVMLIVVGILLGAIVGFNLFKGSMIRKYMSQGGIPPATVTTAKAAYQDWRDELSAVGTLRAARGVDLSTEITGLVRAVGFKSGQDVRAGQVLVELNGDAERAQVDATRVALELARTTLNRDREQLASQAVSQATVDNDDADVRGKVALLAQQQATLDKKTIRAPFAGRLGISTVNPGQYVNTGDKIVTLQAIDPVFVDFFLPQQDVARLAKGQTITLSTDAFPQREFTGSVNAINPAVDASTRNIQVEATVANPKGELLPGMFAKVALQTGAVPARYITLPQSAITYNPYGATVFVGKPGPAAKDAAAGKDGGNLVAAQVFVTPGPTRGDQVAILKGIDEGTLVVTSGQMKLKNGTPLIVNNATLPPNEPNPTPQEH